MDSSWKNSSSWYDKIVADEGHYYHQKIVLPNALRMLDLKKGDSLLDLACGQGVLGRSIPSDVAYLGIDGSDGLLKSAKKRSKREFLCHDLSTPLTLKRTFSHAAIILAFQNIEKSGEVLKTASKHLDKNGKLLLVLNHPAFRIPRQSHWGIDEKRKLQYRKVDRYLSPLSIPIHVSPSKKEQSQTVWSYHHSFHDIFRMLSEAGLCTLQLEEWISDKKSTGKNAKMENTARKEFPLFLSLLTQKR